MDDDDTRQSADDALEQDDIFDPRHDEPTLAEDNDPPAAPADDIRAAVPIDDPETDDQLDSDELYQEGFAGATNTDDEAIGPDEEPRPLDSADES